MSRTLVVFDFDGTLTVRDSFFQFLLFAFGIYETFIGILANSHILILYKFGWIPPSRAKEKLFRYFFGGASVESLKSVADRFAAKYLSKFLREQAVSILNYHRSLGHEVVIISASADLWLAPMCKSLDVMLICTKLEIEEDKYTGNIIGENCNREEKKRVLLENFSPHLYDDIFVYGDSAGDTELLNFASKPFLYKKGFGFVKFEKF